MGCREDGIKTVGGGREGGREGGRSVVSGANEYFHMACNKGRYRYRDKCSHIVFFFLYVLQKMCRSR